MDSEAGMVNFMPVGAGIVVVLTDFKPTMDGGRGWVGKFRSSQHPPPHTDIPALACVKE